MKNGRIEERERRLRAAMTPLCADDNFKTFMGLIRDMKDEAVEFAATHDQVKDVRLTVASLGAVRTYLEIISVHDNALHYIEEEIRRFEESKEQAS